MQLFFSDQIDGEHIVLDGQEAKHCAQVLRKRTGDIIQVTDGRGFLYTTRLLEVGKSSCIAVVEQKEETVSDHYHLHIAIAPTKNNSRTEWFVEKAIEFGVHEISFIHCFHSEKQYFKTDRIRKIAIAAMKQSLHFRLPVIHELLPFQAFIEGLHSDEDYFIAHCDPGEKRLLKEVYSSQKDTLVCIGPEGDFSAQEIEEARIKGFKEISLGKNRLRTETAGVAVCCMINMLNTL